MTASLIISIFAVGVSLFALGWNVYRDLVLKPRLRVKVGLGRELPHEDGTTVVISSFTRNPPEQSFVFLEAINYGPGPIKCTGFYTYRRKSRWCNAGFLIGRIDTMPGHQLCSSLPKVLSVGESAYMVIPYGPNCFLAQPWDSIGFKDSFGRYHKANARSFRRLKSAYRRDYGER